MVDGDGMILAGLQNDYGDEWTFGRTYRGDVPHWWMATRKRPLAHREMEKGLAASLVEDTASDLRAKLVMQRELGKTHKDLRPRPPAPAGPAPAMPTPAAWKPAHL